MNRLAMRMPFVYDEDVSNTGENRLVELLGPSVVLCLASQGTNPSLEAEFVCGNRFEFKPICKLGNGTFGFEGKCLGEDIV